MGAHLLQRQKRRRDFHLIWALPARSYLIHTTHYPQGRPWWPLDLSAILSHSHRLGFLITPDYPTSEAIPFAPMLFQFSRVCPLASHHPISPFLDSLSPHDQFAFFWGGV